jgi:hypothetical protein
MGKNPWIKELINFFNPLKERTVVNVKFLIDDGDISILKINSENNKYLTEIGQSEDCPMLKEYRDKFLDTYGRLTRKGRKDNELPS